MVFQEGSLVKNISFIGRNMKKILFIDQDEKNSSLFPENSFQIKPFHGDKSDK
jgi:TFIIF-interacting CTD phosphatase-like protein